MIPIGKKIINSKGNRECWGGSGILYVFSLKGKEALSDGVTSEQRTKGSKKTNQIDKQISKGRMFQGIIMF